MRQTPLLVLGDGPPDGAIRSGLGRVAHDIAWLLAGLPEFRVGWMGRLAFGRSHYPWTCYSFGAHEQFGERRLREAWNDLSRGEQGIVFTIWDASRLLWLAHPSAPELAWLKNPPFKRWGYFMADAEGCIERRLPMEQAAVIAGYDRVCMASEWAYALAINSTQPQLHSKIDWIPHMINASVFCRRGRDEIRSAWNIGDGEKLIGCVMANQERKSWATVLDAFSKIEHKAKLWIRTDKMRPDASGGYWNIEALAIEYGVEMNIILEDRLLSDEEMAMRYSACDLTIMLSGGEGFCYPVAESLACGTGVVTGTYSAQYELTKDVCVPVHPVGGEIRTLHNVRRAVYDPRAVALTAQQMLDHPLPAERYADVVEHLDGRKLGLVWQRWLREGLQ